MDTVLDVLNKINSDTSILYISIRTVIIYIYAIILLRIGNKRFHFATAFDIIFIIIVGSVLSRTIDGSATLLKAIVGSAILMFMHWLFAVIAFYSQSFGCLIKGKSDILVKDGKILWDTLKKNQVTQDDLLEMCREKLNHDNLENVKEARLERTGKISFIIYK